MVRHLLGTSDRRALLRAELHALYAHLYGLDESDIRYVLDPGDDPAMDWHASTFRVLKDRQSKDFDEYRTKRMVLDAWQRIASGSLFADDRRNWVHLSSDTPALMVNGQSE